MKKTFNKLCFLVAAIIFLAGGIYWYQKNKITFSVIIPVYNAEKYLPKCLDSVLKQKGDFEVIAINDGSKDKSLQILQDYAKKYKNLKIIDEKNQGVSAARNVGLKAVNSRYVTFVDSDDWLEPDAFKQVLAVIKSDKPDVVLTGYYDVYDREWVRSVRGEEAAKEVAEENKFIDKKLDKLVLFSPFRGKDAHSDLFYAGGGIRGRFYQKNFLDKYQIEFSPEIQNHEDDVFMFRVYLHNPLISVLSTPIYNYRNRADSISKSEKVLKNMAKSLAVMEKTSEFQSAPRYIQILIKDSWLSLVFLGLANLERHGVSPQKGYEQAYRALQGFSMYNQKELKSARNYQKLRSMLMNNAH